MDKETLKKLVIPGTERTDDRKQLYSVEIYNGKSLMEVIEMEAKDPEDASNKARSQFFQDIHVKIKRAWK